MKRFITLSLVILFLGATSLAQTPQKPSQEGRGAADVVRAFWQALGDLDGDGVVACLDWPNIIIESSDRGTKPAKTNVDGEAVKAEIARSRSKERNPQRGDFFGAVVTQLDVRPVNSTLVYVPHRCRVGGDGAGSEGREGREFDALAIVRQDITGTWRIVVITVAQ